MPLASILVGFQSLRSNVIRTVLSTLGVVMGVASLVAVLALGDGMERYVRDQIEQTTSLQSVVVRPLAGRQVDGVFMPDTAAPYIDASDAALVRAVPGVRDVVLTVDGTGLARASDAAPSSAARGVYVKGVLAGDSQLARMVPAAGRMFTGGELDAAVPVAVLSDSAAQLLAPGRPAASLIGDSVILEGESFVVLGVLAADAGPDAPTIHLPYARAGDAMAPSRVPRLPTLVAMIDSAESILPARDAIERALLLAHPAWKDRFTARTNESRVRQAAQGILLFKLFMGAITGISLLVGGIGIMNVLLAAVAERTREIGIRRAAGARRRDILVQFLSESVAITALGSGIGLVVGLAGAVGGTAIMRQLTHAQMHAGFSWGTLLVAAGAAVGVGLVFGTYPAMRASRLSPIDAIHHE